MESKLVISIPTKCNLCVWERNCHKDARDPDCYPYGAGCDEFTSQRQIIAEFFSTPDRPVTPRELSDFVMADASGFVKMAEKIVHTMTNPA